MAADLAFLAKLSKPELLALIADQGWCRQDLQDSALKARRAHLQQRARAAWQDYLDLRAQQTAQWPAGIPLTSAADCAAYVRLSQRAPAAVKRSFKLYDQADGEIAL